MIITLLFSILIIVVINLLWLRKLLQAAPTPAKRPDAGPYCQGFVHIDWVDQNEPGDLVVGELRCNGTCPDSSQCTVKFQEFPDRTTGLVRVEWCGCNETEPAHCHLRREKYISESGKIIWKTNCRPITGSCPAEGDYCREVWREIQAPEGIHKRYQVMCECVSRNE